ncbi:MAG: energy transducer TonB [Pseudomonadota bacterium]|nr:energy transducer TonB [Pseudomonadota bacterium]
MTATNPQVRQSRRLSATSATLVVALSLALAACGKDEPAPDAPSATAAAPAVAPDAAVSAKVTAMSPDDLREGARQAYADNRLYAPAENNAVEYYLALRDKVPGDPAVASALTDLLPMTVIATEQSVNRDDFPEAQRLVALLEKADPQHPALSRLKSSIQERQLAAVEKARQEKLSADEQAAQKLKMEQQRIADQKQQQEQAARQLAAQPAPAAPAAVPKPTPAADQRAAEQRAAEKAAAERLAAEKREAEQRAAAARAARSATPTVADLRPLSTPAPKFPTEALRSGQSGEVQVEFTVNPDGSVSDVRVVQSNPARVFDREAISAVRRWRFQPISAPLTTRRTIGFNPGT